ncbi:hypothetical protein Dimus_009298 [Dionaea muscipula]
METKILWDVAKEQSSSHVPHAVLLPLPLQGHMVPFLNLAELLSFVGVKVTLLLTEQINHRLTQFSDLKQRFEPFPAFKIKTISDGLGPLDPPRSIDDIIGVIHAWDSISQPQLKEMLASGSLVSDDRPEIACIIADAIYGFPIDDLSEFQIPSIAFYPQNAANIWCCLSTLDLLEAGKLQRTGDKNDEIDCIPGLEGLLRANDLPLESSEALTRIVMAFLQSQQADAIIVNTFEDLEGPILTRIRSKCPNIYTLGPLHLHSESRLSSKPTSGSSQASIWSEDKSCMAWLDNQPLRSVVYICFGTTGILTKDEFIELWHGLVDSNKRFLWVMGPDIVQGVSSEDNLLTELVEKADGRGYLIKWAPQKQVLAHPAVGSFLMHCGWNAIMESIVAGVPMICWPYHPEHVLNSRCLSKWFNAVDLKEYPCERGVISRVINEVMEDRKDELMESARVISTLANKAVSKGGTSYNNLDSLVEHIQLTSCRASTSKTKN